MKAFEAYTECSVCNGTGVYVGMAERDGAGVVCNKCNGTGMYKFRYEYKPFVTRKSRDDVTRVYKRGYGYVIGTSKIEFDGVEIDMGKEGVSYEEFLDGKKPKHIETMVCPMLADQSACHRVDGFVDVCNEKNGGWINYLPKCEYQPNKAECWNRFKVGIYDENT